MLLNVEALVAPGCMLLDWGSRMLKSACRTLRVIGYTPKKATPESGVRFPLDRGPLGSGNILTRGARHTHNRWGKCRPATLKRLGATFWRAVRSPCGVILLDRS